MMLSSVHRASDSLKRVNTCTLKLRIALKETDKSTLETDLESETDKQSTVATNYPPSTHVTDSEVEDAIKLFVTPPASKDDAAVETPKLPLPGAIDVHRYDLLASQLTNSPNATILPRNFILKAKSTPYDQLCLSQGKDPSKSIARLSVTKILPFNWCELRTIFNVYDGVFEKPQTAPMLRGKLEHSVFERTTHPSKSYSIDLDGVEKEIHIEQTHSFSQLPAEPIVQEELEDIGKRGLQIDPKLRELAVKWTSTVLRLLTLFQFGECREVLVHAMYDRENSCLLEGGGATGSSPLDPDNYILISGIIDHLMFENDTAEGVFEGYQEELKDSITDFLDISDLIKQVGLRANTWCDKNDPFLYVTVKDLKTRKSRSLPHPAQQQSAKYQVGMYRKFLELLSRDPRLTYQLMIINAQKRGIDPFQVLPEALVSELILQNHYLIRDFERLKNGKQIGFEAYDEDSRVSKDHFKLSLRGESTTPSQLLGKWETPPTLAYLAARMSQLYHTLNPFFSDRNYIEYSCQGEVFRQMPYRYNEKEIDQAIDQGMALWLGKREPEGPFVKSICKYCDFHQQCEWHLRQEGAIN
ncbi:DEKNAAC101482 [Brettanomyces naardenensis]|uniref:Exonuclease V, mitochondrial n=1 Tax=Brettanomyces naardenensis TaxID=13370 RepID=A0A448YIC1_BRENA|nr:DEKNAAC101482 [Brettanomyces naardenensis]